MRIKAAVIDVDEILAAGADAAHEKNLAVCCKKLADSGAVILAATGYVRSAAQAVLGKKIKPDYFIAANGAQASDASGGALWQISMTAEEMYALVDFCEDYDIPLEFIFEDGSYAYVEYSLICRMREKQSDRIPMAKDGEDQVRHRESMPFGACAAMSEAQMEQFVKKYGYLGWSITALSSGWYSISHSGCTKQQAAARLVRQAGIRWEETHVFGSAEECFTAQEP